MERYLIDTNSVSDYLSDLFTYSGAQFMDTIVNQTPKISIITQIELLCWKTDDEIGVKQFIKDSQVFNISDDIVQHCVNIRRSKRIKVPDAIIAATALAHDCILITENISDFRNIKGLKLINPHTL